MNKEPYEIEAGSYQDITFYTLKPGISTPNSVALVDPHHSKLLTWIHVQFFACQVCRNNDSEQYLLGQFNGF